MSEQDKLTYREEIRKEFEQEFNEKELKKIRKLLEDLNRENADDHKLFSVKFLNVFDKIDRHGESIEVLKKKTLWHIVIEYIKENPKFVAGSTFTLITYQNLDYIYKILELIIK